MEDFTRYFANFSPTCFLSSIKDTEIPGTMATQVTYSITYQKILQDILPIFILPVSEVLLKTLRL